ncbi:MAG: mechanosensitive ion channel family protein [Rhodospirillales bacterium]
MAAAQTTAPAEGATVAELEALVRTIENQADREKLLVQLRGLIEARRQAAAPAAEPGIGQRLLSGLTAGAQTASRDFIEAIDMFRGLPALLDRVYDDLADPAIRLAWLRFLATMLAVAVAGLMAARLLSALLRPVRRSLESRGGAGLTTRLVLGLLRAVVELVPVAGFAGAAYATILLVGPHRVTHLVAMALIAVNLMVQGVSVVARFMFQPDSPALRVLPVRDDTANYACVWVARIAATAGYGYFAGQAALMLGLSQGAHDIYLRVLGLAIAAMLAILVLQNRTAAAAAMRAAPPGAPEREGGFWTLRNRLSELWHVLALIAITGIYLVWALGVRNGFSFIAGSLALSIAILFGAWVLERGARRLVDSILHVSDELEATYPGLQARVSRYRVVLDTVFRIVVWLVAAFLLAEAWGVPSIDWLVSRGGQHLLSVLFSTLVVGVIAIILWELANSLIERRMTGGALGMRARTLLPLLHTTIKVFLVIIVGLVALSTLGIDITPLLAGAGVIGLAIGFGSQALVKDVITGFFILMEDQIAVGDVVQVANRSGLVEAITIRTVRLRDQAGSVHTIPFGEITSVQNMTREYSYYVFDISVDYREDTDRVVAVIGEIGAQMQTEDAWRDRILEPLEVLGVDSFGDSAVVIKARIKTRPIQQWSVGREFNRRMKKRFDAEGIEIPFPHRTVYIAGGTPPAAGAEKPEPAPG